MPEESTIWVVAQSEDVSGDEVREGERAPIDIGGGWSKAKDAVVQFARRKRVPLDALALKAQMDGLIKVVGELFSQADVQTGMTLSEVELSVEINAEGQVSLVGNGGKLGSTGGITLKFVRPKQS